jgi:alpha-glucosidase (family GH31 glycosyl hydrolase)
LEAANQAVEDGSPINRPLWWVDPTDIETYTIDQGLCFFNLIKIFNNANHLWITEYMLGDRILVAPVVDEEVTSRDIYLRKTINKSPLN